MTDALASLIQSPKLQEHFIRLRDYIKEEQQKRKDFYDFVTEDMKAEFINGEVIIHSPVANEHESVSSELYTLLNVFISINSLGRVTHEKLMISLTRNDYEPDICFFRKEKAAKFKEGQKLFPAPDMLVEILSRSTEKYDRGIKFEDYALHNIKEYWIIDPRQKTIEKYLLKNKKYELDEKVHNGNIISSTVIKGFSIPARAIFNKKIFLETLNQISNSKK
jgi:Uma2 family endonuclease